MEYLTVILYDNADLLGRSLSLDFVNFMTVPDYVFNLHLSNWEEVTPSARVGVLL